MVGVRGTQFSICLQCLAKEKEIEFPPNSLSLQKLASAS